MKRITVGYNGVSVYARLGETIGKGISEKAAKRNLFKKIAQEYAFTVVASTVACAWVYLMLIA